jgi:lipid A 3-O-deacylase
MQNKNRFKTHLIGCTFIASLLSLSGWALADNASGSLCPTKSGVKTLRQYPDVYNFYYENDLFNGTDSNYTNGVKVSWVSANMEDYVSDPCLPLWVRQLNRLSESLQPGSFISRNMVVIAGQSMYTPRNRTRRDLIKNDRPYAGWLYLGLAYNARDERQMDTVEIDVGVVGPASLARQSQNFIHDLRDIDRFNGWGNQLNNELGLQLVKERKTKIFTSANTSGPKFDAITHYGGSIGNVKTYLNAGVELRVGTYLPDDFGTSQIRPASDSNAPLSESATRRLADSGVHAFVALDARAVARDIFLDGNTFSNSHRVKKERFVGDVAFGVAWQWQGVKITYAQYLRSKEFRAQQDTHGYGSLTLSLEY